MKDFLQGRVSVPPTRSTTSSLPVPSHLPPINHPTVTIEETQSPSLEEGENLMDSIEEPLPAAPAAAQCLAEPRVEMVPDAEGRIGHIVVTCRCGEIITLQCNY
jgi:hypothetical protein